MELDKDLAARQEARDLCVQGEKAQRILSQMPQEKLDAIVKSIADAFAASAKELARLAAEETGFGNVPDKVEKNRFASQDVWNANRILYCGRTFWKRCRKGRNYKRMHHYKNWWNYCGRWNGSPE